MPGQQTYSFADVTANIVGPGGAVPIGSTSGSDDEGITIEYVEDQNAMKTGADGTVMHNLHLSKAGRVTIRLLKTSPVNALLYALYNFQRQSAATWGQNTIIISDLARGDVSTNQQAAFRKGATVNWGKDGASLTWEFDVGVMDNLLGSGAPSLFGLG